jgi:hypothetical protein
MNFLIPLGSFLLALVLALLGGPIHGALAVRSPGSQTTEECKITITITDCPKEFIAAEDYWMSFRVTVEGPREKCLPAVVRVVGRIKFSALGLRQVTTGVTLYPPGAENGTGNPQFKFEEVYLVKVSKSGIVTPGGTYNFSEFGTQGIEITVTATAADGTEAIPEICRSKKKAPHIGGGETCHVKVKITDCPDLNRDTEALVSFRVDVSLQREQICLPATVEVTVAIVTDPKEARCIVTPTSARLDPGGGLSATQLQTSQAYRLVIDQAGGCRVNGVPMGYTFADPAVRRIDVTVKVTSADGQTDSDTCRIGG